MSAMGSWPPGNFRRASRVDWGPERPARPHGERTTLRNRGRYRRKRDDLAGRGADDCGERALFPVECLAPGIESATMLRFIAGSEIPVKGGIDLFGTIAACSRGAVRWRNWIPPTAFTAH